MIRFSSNLSLMFKEHNFLDRFEAANNAGFNAIEMQFPYNWDPQELLEKKEQFDLQITVINIEAGDLISGGPGLAAMPGREDLFKKAVEKAYQFAETLKPLNMNVLPGWPPMDQFDRMQCVDVLVNNLRYASETLDHIGTQVVVEACNTFDRPGFLISTSAQAIEVIEKVGHSNLAFQYDLYHMHLMEGNNINRIDEIIDSIGHIQFADAPGRHEPGTGEVDFKKIFKHLDKIDWNGWIAAEYLPSRPTIETLEWLRWNL